MTIPALARRGTEAGDSVHETAEATALVVADTLACAAVGRDHPTVRRLRDARETDAVVLDATAAHCDELDPVHARSGTVPGAVVVPPALRLGGRADGARFLGAVAAGYEVVVSAALHLGGSALYQRSWWPGALTGRLGAAMAAAYVLGLDRKQTEHALALAAASIGGLLAEDVFADGHYVLLGDSASAGVRAAHRAAAGLRGSLTLLDGPARRAFPGEAADSTRPHVLDGLHKEFPCATPLQAVIRGLRALGGVAEATAVEVALPAPALAFVSTDRIVDGPPEAAASLAYAVGAVAHGREHDVGFFRKADPGTTGTQRLALVPSSDRDAVGLTVTTADGHVRHRREPLRANEDPHVLFGRKVRAFLGDEWSSLPADIAAGKPPDQLLPI